jgi:hypothetical protein
MKRLLTLMVSMIALSSVTACGSNNVTFTDLPPVQAVSAMNDQNLSVIDAIREHEEEHTVVNTSYQDPATHNNSMTMQIDFSCPEGGKDSLTASSSPNAPYQVTIAHHNGKIVHVDFKNKEMVGQVIEFVSAFKTTNDKDKQVVGILIKDLNGFLKAKNLRKRSK